MSSLLLRRRSTVLAWSAAAVTAAALFLLPYALLGTFSSGRWSPALVVDLAVLLVVAVRLWSPLVVLGASLLSAVGLALAWAIAGGDSCGTSAAAGWIEPVGALALALPLGAWGVRRSAWALAAIPAGWIVAGFWILGVSHVLPGGTGACFD